MKHNIFSPLKLGDIELPHRIAMAPLTRSRAMQPGNAPGPINIEYYRQRASAALLITEATQISQQAQGYAWTPGIYTPEQIAGWQDVANAVHQQGGRIFLQLWHVGRVSHPSFQPGFALPVAPTAMPVPGKTFIEGESGKGEWSDVPVPQALSEAGITAIVEDYRQAARNAMLAGMDGVEIHAGNGYLIDQFINSNSNKRSDNFGGNIENRARFLMQVVDAVVAEVGASKVAVRLTPMGRFMGMGDDTPMETFVYISKELDKRQLAYLHLVEPAIVGIVKDDEFNPEWDLIIRAMRESWSGILMIAGGYDLETAKQALDQGRADIVAFGRPFIANPDLPERFMRNAPLNPADSTTFFGGNEKGYIDYPVMDK